jgi:translation initiation factor 1A
MGKNRKGGKGRKRGKNCEEHIDKETIFKEDGMDYGYVNKALGNSRFEIYCGDGENRLGILRGSIRRKVWIKSGDLVLYGMRDFQDSKIDIVHKYTNEDIQRLYRYGEITKIMYKMYTADISSGENNGNGSSHENDIEFMDEDMEMEMEKELGDLVDSNQTMSSPDGGGGSSGV